MGKLRDAVNAKSKFLKIEFGETTPPMIYKGFQEVTNSFGQQTFRYTFEFSTENGFLSKTFDCGSSDLALQLDEIPFGTQITISREHQIDDDGNPAKTSNGQHFLSKYKVEKWG